MSWKLVPFLFYLFLTVVSHAQYGRALVVDAVNRDTVLALASYRYSDILLHRRILMGKNYRKTWSQPVILPVFYFSRSGLVAERLGGGKQTKSLRLKDANNETWVLRTVEKDVSAEFPKWIVNTPVGILKQDLVSADHPYAGTVIAELLKACGILAPDPKYYFVADEEALGEYRDFFANTVCMLEKYAPTQNGSKAIDTDSLLQKMAEDNRYVVLQKTLLKIRILDMLMGDWDRHAGQWNWGLIDTGATKYFYPIPRDRDHALSSVTGFLPLLLQKTFMPFLRGLNGNSTALKKLNQKNLLFDQQFLNAMDAEDWKTTTAIVQKEISDAVIENAVNTLPPQVLAMDGDKIKKKLRNRREGLLKNVMDYYSSLSHTVYVWGSDNSETFRFTDKNGKILLTVSGLNDKQERKIYERTFDPAITKLVHLEGKNGADQFYIDKNVKSSIALVINGGEGHDVYNLNGTIKTSVYDSQSENTHTVTNSSTTYYLK